MKIGRRHYGRGVMGYGWSCWCSTTGLLLRGNIRTLAVAHPLQRAIMISHPARLRLPSARFMFTCAAYRQSAAVMDSRPCRRADPTEYVCTGIGQRARRECC